MNQKRSLPNKGREVTGKVHMQYQGPLPIASEVERYNNILPGAADRLFTMAEIEQQSRHQLQDKALDIQSQMHKRDSWSYRMALFCSILICGGILVLAGMLALQGAYTEATGAIVGLSAIIAAFLFTHRRKAE